MNTSSYSASYSGRRTGPLEAGSHAGPWKWEQVVKMVSEMGWGDARSILDAHPGFRAKVFPLPVTCLVVASILMEVQRMYLQRPSSPFRPMSSASPSAASAGAKHQCLTEECSCSALNHAGEPLQYQRAHALESRHS